MKLLCPCFHLIFLFMLVLVARPIYSQIAPETTIISGPNGLPVSYDDVTFWWVGIPTDASARIVGYFYELDNHGRVFTATNHITFFGLEEHEHILRVSAVDTNGLEDTSPDEHTRNRAYASPHEL